MLWAGAWKQKDQGLKVALLQMCSSTDMSANLAAIDEGVRAASAKGASCVFLPEGCTYLERDAQTLRETLASGRDEACLPELAAIARKAGVWLHAGSVILSGTPTHAVNRTHVFAPDGSLSATYDKIHLFQVALAGDEVYREADSFSAGARAVVAQTGAARVGLSICYDVRFAYLYRSLAQAGAQVLSVPAAFTRTTGRAHWEVLLRARAIETGCWVVAAAQGGVHADGRKTWGHSMVVSPWGEVMAHLDHDRPDLLVTDLDLGLVGQARKRLPCLDHDRSFVGP